MFLRTVIVAILLMPMLFGLTGFVSRSDAGSEIDVASSAALVHEACAADHSNCNADGCGTSGHCVNCTALPVGPEALGIVSSVEAVLLPPLLPLRSGRNILPAQEPPQPV